MSISPISDVFCITNEDGSLLHPAIQATILARYSRSSQSAKEIVLNLTSEDADKFQERWVGRYGHNSVAELANIPICFENISIIASKFIESWQRAGYSEKSTRYQIFNRNSFITPDGAPSTMKNFSSRLYDAYENILPKLLKIVSEITGEDIEKATVKARAFDNIRYLLPAGTGTNVAAVLNIRDVINMIKSMTGHCNPEFRKLGHALYETSNQFCPALLKHVSPNNFQMQLKTVGKMNHEVQIGKNKPYVIIDRPHLMPDPVIQQDSFKSLVEQRYGMSWEAFTKFMNCRPEHSEVPDPFKTINI
ncbi:MAG TPA: FAD-dependent thymidylate synthase, partial [Ignavibacteria bacterium]|nr:FAD-dependent thymidylate synthase [Ignavibacteria bacterium]